MTKAKSSAQPPVAAPRSPSKPTAKAVATLGKLMNARVTTMAKAKG